MLDRMIETILKLATVTVSRYYGANEEFTIGLFLAAINCDAVGLVRTALTDTPPSDDATFRLHGSLLAWLRTYLPPSAAKMWRDACDNFVSRKV